MDKELLKQSPSNYNKMEVSDSTILESNEYINQSESINNSSNNITAKNRTMSLGRYQTNINKNNSNQNIINYHNNIQINSQEIKTNHPGSSLNINSRNNSGTISNNIHVLPGLKRRNTTNDEINTDNVRSSQIYTIPKTFYNKDIENTKDSDNNEEEAEINEDSSGEILYMSFDRKPKRNNTLSEFDNDHNNDDDNKSSDDPPKGVNFEI